MNGTRWQFGYARAEAPELAVIEGPLLLLATIGLLPMGLMLMTGARGGNDVPASNEPGSPPN